MRQVAYLAITSKKLRIWQETWKHRYKSSQFYGNPKRWLSRQIVERWEWRSSNGVAWGGGTAPTPRSRRAIALMIPYIATLAAPALTSLRLGQGDGRTARSKPSSQTFAGAFFGCISPPVCATRNGPAGYIWPIWAIRRVRFSNSIALRTEPRQEAACCWETLSAGVTIVNGEHFICGKEAFHHGVNDVQGHGMFWSRRLDSSRLPTGIDPGPAMPTTV